MVKFPTNMRIIVIPAFLAVFYFFAWIAICVRHSLNLQNNAKLLRNTPIIANAAAVELVKPLTETNKNELITNNHRTIQDQNSSKHQNSNILWTQQDFECVAWRKTKECSPFGPREVEGDLKCDELVSRFTSGYCEIRNKTSGEIHKVAHAYCGGSGEDFKCGDIAMEFANYKTLGDMRVKYPEQMPVYTPIESPSRGIIIAAYKEVLINAFVNIKLLRHHGCTLPIELWFKTGELTPRDPLVQELTSKYNVILRIIREEPIRKWLVKIYAVFYSRFDEVLLLDADNVPAADPTYLFDLKEFKSNSAIFWPDYWRPGASIFDFNEHSMVWELLGIKPVMMFEQESGQVLIDRRKSAVPLNLLLFYSYHFDLIEKLRLVWGDKDLFRLAWLKVNQPFHMIQRPPGSAGLHMDEFFCGVTMVQHDTRGNPIFFHRNTIKFSKDSGNKLWWTHIQQYISVYDPMEFRVENTLRKNHPFGPFDCFGAYRYKDFLGTDGSRKFNVTEIKNTPFADLELNALMFAKEGRALAGEII